MTCSPFSRAVISCMRTIYPECLADKSFDNTGLLLEAPFLPNKRNRNSVLLTIDLTRAVAEEAIRNNHSIVISYHPIIFRGLKAITLDDSQQQSLLKLAANGISVYSPHTAVDVVPDGMADWLCDIVTGKQEPSESINHTIEPRSPASETDVTTSGSESHQSTKPTTPSVVEPESVPDPFGPETPTQDKSRRPTGHHRTYSRPIYPQSDSNFKPGFDSSPKIEHTRSVIISSSQSSLDEANSANQTSKDDNPPQYTDKNTGAGRIITFNQPQPLTDLINIIANRIGQPKGFPIAIPQQSSIDSIFIKTLALCPGSGSSIFKSKLEKSSDLLFTGEMSHHDALYFIENHNSSIITLFHSNSERGYLEEVMKPKLEKILFKKWENLRNEMKKEDLAGKFGIDGLEEILEDDSFHVVVSEKDRDPYGIVVLNNSDIDGVEL